MLGLDGMKQLFKHASSKGGMPSSAYKPSMGSFYALRAKSIEGKEVDFKRYEGLVSLVVNVASK